MATNDMRGRVCLITGANKGIGKETTLGLAERGATVVMVCRDRTNGQTAQAEIRARSGNPSVDIMFADLSSQESLCQLVRDYHGGYDRLDVLINNAGILSRTRSLTEDGIESTFAVNHMAYFLLANLLLDTLKKSAPSRIINVSSQAHRQARLDFDDLQCGVRYSGPRAYNQSKLANILFTHELSSRLERTGVTVNCLHPGVVRTNLLEDYFRSVGAGFAFFLLRPFFVSPARGARTSIYLASAPELEGVSGKYFINSKEVKSSASSYDENAARRLWETSRRLVGHGVEYKEAQQ